MGIKEWFFYQPQPIREESVSIEFHRDPKMFGYCVGDHALERIDNDIDPDEIQIVGHAASKRLAAAANRFLKVQ